MSGRPFSLLLPEGGRSAVQKATVHGAVVEAYRTNASRAARGLPLVRLLNRDTGVVYDVPPDADTLALSDAVERDVAASVLPSPAMSPRGGAQPGAGRKKRTEPEGASDVARNRTISIYDSEWRDITAAAAADGDTPGGWMRDLAVAVARGKARIVREDTEP